MWKSFPDVSSPFLSFRPVVDVQFSMLGHSRRHLSLHVLHWGAYGELGRAVAAVLKQNSSLQSLCLKADGTNLSDKTGVVLAQALTQNSSLSRCLVASVNSLPLSHPGQSFILVSFELEGARCARGSWLLMLLASDCHVLWIRVIERWLRYVLQHSRD